MKPRDYLVLARARGTEPLTALSPVLEIDRASELADHLIRNYSARKRRALGGKATDVASRVVPPVIVISHQPTLLAYAGVYVQFLLADHIGRMVEQRTGIVPKIVYLCLDMDDALDRRIKTAHVPLPTARGGAIHLTAPLQRRHKGKPQRNAPPIEASTVQGWAMKLRGAYGSIIDALPNRRDELVDSRNRMISSLERRYGGLGAANFAQCSHDVLLKFANEICRYPIDSVYLSDLVRSDCCEFSFLLEHWSDICASIAGFTADFQREGGDATGLMRLAGHPAWLVCCRCGTRNSVTAGDGLEWLSRRSRNNCSNCDRSLLSSSLIPRVVLEDLLGARLTQASLVLTYAGSAGHVMASGRVHEDVFGCESPIYTWHPKHILDSALLRAAAELSLGHKFSDRARSAVHLATTGRDPLICADETGDIGNIVSNWEQHFSTNILSKTMIVRSPQ